MLRFFNPLRTGSTSADGEPLAQALDVLSTQAPEDAVRQSAEWLEALGQFQDTAPEQALRLLAQLDEATQPALRSLREAYALSSLRSELWARARHCTTQLAGRYEELLQNPRTASVLEPARLAELCVRLVRASASQQRWDSLHYGPFDQRHWARTGDAYLAAQRADLLDKPVRIRAGREAQTTVAREYLRSVALATAALDELDEIQIEQAWRLVHYVLPALRLETEPGEDSIFWIHPATGRRPQRMVHPPSQGERPLYFSGSAALAALLNLEGQLREGAVPPELGFDAEEGAARLGPLLHHLIRHWSAEPPVRRHRRHKLAAQLQVVEGVEFLVDHLSGLAGLPINTWEQWDASLNGVGASAPLSEKRPLRIGTLLGLLSEDGNRWLVGIVRRMLREAEERALVGVEILSWHPHTARADDGAREQRVLVLDPLTRGGIVRVVLPEGELRRGAPLYLLGHSKALKLLPQSVVERGADFEIRSYQLANAAAMGE